MLGVWVLVLALSSLQAALIPDCYQGEGHWCTSLENAKKCGTVEYCQTRVWGKSECKLCHIFVGKLKEYLGRNKTEEQLIGQLQVTCQLFTMDTESAATCRRFYRAVLPTILQDVKQAASTDSLCEATQLCSDRTNREGMEFWEILSGATAVLKEGLLSLPPIGDGSKPDKEVCDFCQRNLARYQGYLGKPDTVVKIQEIVQAICNMDPNPRSRDQCLTFSKTRLPGFIKLTLGIQPAGVCALIGACENRIQDPVVLSSDEADPATCFYCLGGVELVSHYISLPPVRENLTHIADLCCDLIEGERGRLTCHKMVPMSSGWVLENIVQHLKDKSFCGNMGLCPLRTDAQSDQQGAALRELISPASILRLLGDPMTPEPTSSAAVCNLCKSMVGDIQDVLKTPNGEQGILTALDDICDSIPSSYTAMCKNYVKGYGQFALNYIKSQTADNLCQKATLCSADNNPQVSAADGADCTICTFATKAVEDMMNSPEQVKAIVTEIRKSCDDVTRLLRGQCRKIVDKYGAKAVLAVIKCADPKSMCVKIGACSSQASPIPFQVASILPTFIESFTSILSDLDLGTITTDLDLTSTSYNGFIKCKICKLIMGKVTKMAAKMKDKALDTLKAKCDEAPVGKEICRAFMDKYGGNLVDTVLGCVTSGTVCGNIGVCASVDEVSSDFTMYDVTDPKFVPGCTVCEAVVEELESLVTNKATEEEILRAVEQICDIFPPSMGDTCRTTIETYGKMMIDMIVKSESPEAICQALRLCTTGVSLGEEINIVIPE